MSKKEKSTINVEETTAALLQMAQDDEGIKTLLIGLLSQTAIRQQAMTKALISEWNKKGDHPELAAALSALLNIDVARKVREVLVK